MLWIQETYLNATENHLIGESEVFETHTDDRGDLFRSLQREYGRCTGRVYVDRADGPPKAVGWVFVGRDHYADGPGLYGKARETYLREVWVTVHESAPTRTVQYHYA